METYAHGLTFGEAPRWREGALWLSDTQGSRLWTDASGTWSAHPLSSPSNGLWFLPDGRLVAAMMQQRRLGTWDGKRFETYADLAEVADGPLGDMVGDPAGNLFVDDVGYVLGRDPPRPGRLLRVAADGAILIAAENIAFPNGLALIDAGRTLVVAETWKQRLLAFTVGPDGALDDRRQFADLVRIVGPEARPDGIWPARDGGVWVACLTGRVVAHVAPDGLRDLVPIGSGLPVACCTDEDGVRLFVTVAETGGLSLMDAVAAGTLSASVIVERV